MKTLAVDLFDLAWPGSISVGSWVSARLRRDPFAGQPAEATLGVMPLANAREFAEVASFEHETDVPVLVSPRQRYVVLAELVNLLIDTLPLAGPIVMKLGGGEYRVSLPAELLQERVLLCHEPAPMIERLVACGLHNVLGVWSDLRTDGFEQGHNRIVLALLGGAADMRQAFDDLARAPMLLRRLGAVEVHHHD